ncbi:tagaturonate reductase [Mucilaginibacter gracilis]|uniref:Tagaturonate reductase n=1 Tax=Mucilaginibacter gracilis TaxID=423350 RepID=A0A495IWN8_9SPHI|nr:tagaturonate reductase [Mucilaginibacter gracilis]RKR80923.1 tagaturonate reductase [Mucilaginibacter gracilis]
MILSQNNLKSITVPGLIVPGENLFSLPEKVLQFGTGVLLRGLPDYFIDKANRQGIFNGRVVVVKSTDTGSATEFDQQDSLYTLSIKGIENGERIDESVICSAISRVLTAGKDWEAIMEFARNPGLQVVISNTTEVGIQLVEDDINNTPPVSFPGKLLAVLHERYKALGGTPESGLVIVPTELIVDNGKKLKAIVLQLAENNNLDGEFITWLNSANHFCNSLVDRIVPGKPDAKTLDLLESAGGYKDDLRIVSEVYSLWAIEGDEHIKSALTFAQADKGVVIAPDIEIFRELKLRLLNGTHTLTCAVAFLSGFPTVKVAMDDKAFSEFIYELMVNDIAPAIPYNVSTELKHDFAGKVLDRFRNPHIEHMWISISAQYSSKIKMRVVPVLLQHYRLGSTVPQYIAFGFAAFLRFMKVEKNAKGEYIGSNNGVEYKVTDDNAPIFYEAWKLANLEEVVESILANENLWDGPNLTILPDFKEAVLKNLTAIMEHGVLKLTSKKELES